MARLRRDWGEIVAKEDPAPRAIYREPARLASLAGSLMLILAMFFPFASGHLGRAGGVMIPVSLSGLEGAGDGVILLVFGLVAALIVLSRSAAESTAQLVRFAPMALGLAALLVLVTAWRETNEAIAAWINVGGAADRAPGIWRSSAGAILLAIAGTYVSVSRRSRPSTDPTGTFRPSRPDVTAGMGAVIGGLMGSVGGLVLAASLLPASFIALFAFIVVGGALAGATAGSRLGRRIARER